MADLAGHVDLLFRVGHLDVRAAPEERQLRFSAMTNGDNCPPPHSPGQFGALATSATTREAPAAAATPSGACDVLFRMLGGYVLAQCIAVAAMLGIADALADGPRPVGWLAAATGSDERSLERLLRGLANAGVFAETAPAEFALTPLSQHLRRDAEPSLHGLAVLTGTVLYQAWGGLASAVRSGGTAFEQVHGVPFYEYLAERPDARDAANRWMEASGQQWALAVGLEGAVDWSSVRTVVDVGGGTGTLLAGLLSRHEHLRGILFDRPETVAEGAHHAQPLRGRLELVGGDFFERVPAGGDVLLLARVLFNWDDEPARALLRACRRAAGGGATLLVLEPVRKSTRAPDAGTGMDLVNLVLTGGRVRTLPELEQLVAGAGFDLVGARPLAPPWLALEARAPSAASVDLHRRITP